MGRKMRDVRTGQPPGTKTSRKAAKEEAMPRTKAKAKPARQPEPQPAANGPPAEVLTLAEAAAYLRLPEADVLRLVDEQDLPARRVGNEWRFLKAAVQQWLSTPPRKAAGEGIWAAAGALRDDPYLDEMLREIDRMRGRPAAEEE
jgi:excisionase family DNA binding protein